MHVFFSGIGGTGIGPLSLIAKQAGLSVSGSDKQDSAYVHYLQAQGITDIAIGQRKEQIEAIHKREPIDWFVYTSALPMEQPDSPELAFCQKHGIRATKRDEFLSQFLKDKGLKLVAVAGTHGKTTTTAMLIWLLKQLSIPVSYSVGAKLSFGGMGEYNPKSTYFIYEADEFDRNFLSFEPYMSLIAGVDYDHPDIYPTREEYNHAFKQFLSKSEWCVLWDNDAAKLGVHPSNHQWTLDSKDERIDQLLHLPGRVNRQNAWLVANGVETLAEQPLGPLCAHLNRFPGVSRRFELITPGLYSDYAHTPPKIRGALQVAEETGGKRVVVVYEGLHNTRQHFIKDELATLFDNIKELYVVPSYLAREDPKLALLSPEDLIAFMSATSRGHAKAAALDDQLASDIRNHLVNGDLVLCISAGGGGSLDEWLRERFVATQ